MYNMASGFLDVYDFGAKGDGLADDTAAVQKAIDTAYETGKTVYIGAGRFLCGELFLKPGVCVRSEPTWGYRDEDCGSAVLLQRDGRQECLIDLTYASGATLDGLSLEGNGAGDCCGIALRGGAFNKKEDAFRIERCKIQGFSSHGVHLDHVWCFSLRHCMIGGCGGDGVRLHGWDGFVLDNWFSGNRGCGFAGVMPNASVTMTGNRIEWNGDCGIYIHKGNNYNITGNYIDRSGGAAVKIVNGSYDITVTGNIFYRSGKFAAAGKDGYHAVLKDSADIIFTSNAMRIGMDDEKTGVVSPKRALKLEQLANSVVMGNTLESLEEPLDDRGGHTGCVIRDNVGGKNKLPRE